MKKISIAAIIILISLMVVVSTALYLRYVQISNIGHVHVVGIQAFTDSNKTTPVTSIDWGILYSGDIGNETIYLFNNGTSPVTLALTSNNWVPTNGTTYLILEWNLEGQTLAENTGVTALFTLTTVPENIDSDTSPNFTFDIIVTASPI